MEIIRKNELCQFYFRYNNHLTIDSRLLCSGIVQLVVCTVHTGNAFNLVPLHF